jgi:hypothetical protein
MSASLINLLPIKSVGQAVFPAGNEKNVPGGHIRFFSKTCHYFCPVAGNLSALTDLNSAAGVGVELNNPFR